ncbi:MAG: class I SAM-dependent RNA methyltransferase [Geminicoccaceae bacterium]
MSEAEVAIEALGAAGDGIATLDGGSLFVPGALPGERWRVRAGPGGRAVPLLCLQAVPRAVPPCPVFGRCGGCRLQHLTAADYAAFKRRRVTDALGRQGLPAGVVTEPRIGPPASRRRLRLALTRVDGRLRLGLRERSGHAVVALDQCPVAMPELATLLPVLGAALQPWLSRPWPAEASLTLTDAGPDLLLHAARPPTAGERAGVAVLARDAGLARIAWQAGGPPEALLTLRAPVVRLSGVAVEVPPGAFLQASAFGEAELAGAVADWAGEPRQAADLYAGLGTLTLPLAGRARRVLACESDPQAAAALRRAAGGRGVTVAERDLVRRPLQPVELTQELVVLDPPRAGAQTQCAALARSRVPRVIYASCHPESFARDARLLTGGGFVLEEVRPIDQFLWSAEVELAARFVRTSGRANRP